MMSQAAPSAEREHKPLFSMDSGNLLDRQAQACNQPTYLQPPRRKRSAWNKFTHKQTHTDRNKHAASAQTCTQTPDRAAFRKDIHCSLAYWFPKLLSVVCVCRTVEASVHLAGLGSKPTVPASSVWSSKRWKHMVQSQNRATSNSSSRHLWFWTGALIHFAHVFPWLSTSTSVHTLIQCELMTANWDTSAADDVKQKCSTACYRRWSL